ncbi:hypothetical protein Tco_0581607 [Tanacetum coccineum]
MWAPRAGRHDPLPGGTLSLLELCLVVGLRSSLYLHYNLISGLGSLINQISSTRDAFALDPDTRFCWELPAEFLAVPSQVEMVQAKLKTLDALPSLLNKVTNSLNKFAQAITSKKTRGDSVPLACQAALNLQGRRRQIKPQSPSFFKEELKMNI